MMNEIFRMTIGDKLFLAPIDPDRTDRVLDIGCGTGIWSAEFGEMFPHCQVKRQNASLFTASRLNLLL